MKNYLTILLLGLVMTGCSEKDEVSDNVTQKLMNNRWIVKDASFTEGQDYHSWLDIDQTSLYFSSSEEGVRLCVQRDYDTHLGNSTTRDYTFFTYNIKGDDIILNFEDNTSQKLTYKKDHLEDSFGIVYVPQLLSSEDKEWLSQLGPVEGLCGKNLKFKYDSRTNLLEITGTGRMNDYTTSNRPWNNFSISEININEGCTYIGVNAFNGMKSIVEVGNLPSSLEEIGDGAFANTLIQSIKIPNNIISIGNAAFQGCSYLKNVNLSDCDKLQVIGESAFANCPIKEYSFSIPENVRHIGAFAFMGAEFTGNFSFNEKIEEVGSWAFTSCDVGTLRIPNSMKKIAPCAFSGKISTIYIGKGLQEIGKLAFGVNNAGAMYVYLGNPLSVDGDVIDHTSGWTLYVPKGCKTAYSKAQGWKNFKCIIEDSALESGNGIPDNNDDALSYKGYIGGHEYIDLGLSVKWASCNVGANKPTDYGTFFVFGRGDGSDGYTLIDTWVEDDEKEAKNGETVNIIGTSYDMANEQWGASWRLPSREEMSELIDNCTYKWTKQNGIYGCLITSKLNKQSIFFPAGGEYECFYEQNGWNWELSYVGRKGSYWCGEYKYIFEPFSIVSQYGLYALSADFFQDQLYLRHVSKLSTSIYHYAYKRNVRAVTK